MLITVLKTGHLDLTFRAHAVWMQAPPDLLEIARRQRARSRCQEASRMGNRVEHQPARKLSTIFETEGAGGEQWMLKAVHGAGSNERDYVVTITSARNGCGVALDDDALRAWCINTVSMIDEGRRR